MPENFNVGGQAVIEGVMMRGSEGYAIAVRKSDGRIVSETFPFIPITQRRKGFALPVLRGAINLFEMLIIGIKSLEFSANEFEPNDADKGAKSSPGQSSDNSIPKGPLPPPNPQLTSGQLAGILLFSLTLGMLIFVALPNYATHLLGKLILGGEFYPDPAAPWYLKTWYFLSDKNSHLVEENSPLLYNLISGAIRVMIIVSYVWLISLMKDVHRLFQYHGAEHKVVFAHENNIPLEVKNIRPLTTLHPRCGTTFIAIVLLVSIIVFAFLARAIVAVWPGFAAMPFAFRKPCLILLHILFMPLVAGISYEVIKLAARRPRNLILRALVAPGLAFQRITTKEPDDDMILVAILSLQKALAIGQSQEILAGEVFVRQTPLQEAAAG